MTQMMGHFNEILKRQVAVTIITRPAKEYAKDRKSGLESLFFPGTIPNPVTIDSLVLRQSARNDLLTSMLTIFAASHPADKG